MELQIRYIERKTGYADNGPAWIARVGFSKSGRTVYFDGKALRRRQGIGANHYDIQTGEKYWISGVKKDGADRHSAGSGKILLDRSVVEEYLVLTGRDTVDSSRFVLVDIPQDFPVEHLHRLENPGAGDR